MSGVDVIRRARAIPRNRMPRFVIVTESTTVETGGESLLRTQEHEALVLAVGPEGMVLSKHSFESNPDEAYQNLARTFQPASDGPVIPVRRLLVGLGFEATTLRSLLNMAKFPQETIESVVNNRCVLPLSDFTSRLDPDADKDELGDLCAAALNRLLTVQDEPGTWKPGQGQIPTSDWIKARGVAVQIGTASQPEPIWEAVRVWAQLPPAELQILDVLGFCSETALIAGKAASRDYDSRHYYGTDLAPMEEQLGRLAQQVESSREHEAQTADLIANGGEEAQSGVSIDKPRRSAHAQRFSKTLALLRKKLGVRHEGDKMNDLRLGLGPRESVFRHIDETVYRAAFETRLVLYTHIPLNKGGRRRSQDPRKPR
jgi:hypothetical protein